MEESNLLVTLFVTGLVLICIRYLTKYIVKYYNETDHQETNEVEEKKKSDGKANENRTPQQNLMQQHLVQNLNRNLHWRPNSNKPGAYTDSWHLTSLKGHTARIRDMDFSSNGKFLATCAEDPPIVQTTSRVDINIANHQFSDNCSTISSSSSSSGSTSSSSSSSPSSSPGQTKSISPIEHLDVEDTSPKLSRRQRKNRLNQMTQKKMKTKVTTTKKPAAVTQNNSIQVSRPPAPPLRQHTKLNLSENELVKHLRAYLLNENQFLTLGYPVESSLYPKRAIIYKTNDPRLSPPSNIKSFYNTNSSLLVPQQNVESSSTDSGQGSSDEEPSSMSEVESQSLKSKQRQSYIEEKMNKSLNRQDYTSDEKKCVRCGKGFFVTNDGEYLTQEHCAYHWGRLQINPDSTYKKQEYTCCKGKLNSNGCETGRLHVWNGVDFGVNGPFEGYVKTKTRKNNRDNPGVFALDCEMCYTAHGLELTKLTVVGSDGRLVYDAFVKPDREIVDYNTRFSGITARDLSKRNGTTCKSLKEVQSDLLEFIYSDTILIGHGLENDLRALKILHNTVIDTAIAFPHYYGLPFRRSLRSLASSFLKRDIQGSENGHDSFEDARACVELMLWRIRKDRTNNANSIKQEVH